MFIPIRFSPTHIMSNLNTPVSRRRKNLRGCALALSVLLLLGACNSDTGSSDDPQAAANMSVSVQPSEASNTAAHSPSESADNLVEEQWPTTYRAALPGSSMIPYPLYPNATKYRIGGEHGLKIVVFETTDSFGTVDRYFQSMADGELWRLSAETEYVRYSSAQDDQDPWGTQRPGIVIHQFASVDEATRVGASPESITNIIMSYR